MRPVFSALFYSCAFVLTACQPTRGLAAEAGVAKSIGRVESTSIVFKDQHTDPYDRQNLYGMNHAASVMVLDDDTVMAVWFSGPYEASVHQLILGAKSQDGGRTWQPAIEIHDAPRVSDFDPGFIDAGDQIHLFFSNGRWVDSPAPVPSPDGRPQVGVDSFHMLIMTSNDRGQSWSSPTEVNAPAGWNCRSNGLQLKNGDLLLPTHHLKYPHKASVLLSSDAARTWKMGPEIVTPGGVGAAEPSVAELPSGELLMVLRTTDGYLWLVRSRDGGKTWAAPEKQDLPAATSSANLFCTSTGKLVLTHNPTKPPLRTKLTMRTSDNGGRTWSDPLLITEVPAKTESGVHHQVAYPSVCELKDGTLLVVWARIDMGPALQSGVIEAARVRVD